ncbi:hypothetical protein ACH5RR_024919 [Cinchona calisaya]|uniref:Uncharacterized protein n=1 Tax=Cinchona calisaya TaxID=153742 RepID=A0ABD2YY55_9GENT
MYCSSSSTLKWVVPSISQAFPKSSNCPLQSPNHLKFTESAVFKSSTSLPFRFSHIKTRATLDEKDQASEATTSQPTKEVEESVKVLKNAAKTRKVPAQDILSAFYVIKNAKIDPSGFLETLGGNESPGRTWMLIFTAEKKLEGGKYFPITAVQRFDAAEMRIENGVFLGPLGFLTFEGRFSWKKRILAFIFERLRIKIGPFNPFEISFKGKDEREPSNKDPFFIWFYIDEEIAVARGRSGGTAFWVRCQRVGNY